MDQLMQRGSVPVNWFKVGLRRRHANVVVHDVVVRPIAADTQISTSRPQQGFGLW